MITAPDDDDDDDDKGEKGEDTDLPGHHPNASLLGLVIRLFAYIVHTTLWHSSSKVQLMATQYLELAHSTYSDNFTVKCIDESVNRVFTVLTSKLEGQCRFELLIICNVTECCRDRTPYYIFVPISSQVRSWVLPFQVADVWYVKIAASGLVSTPNMVAPCFVLLLNAMFVVRSSMTIPLYPRWYSCVWRRW